MENKEQIKLTIIVPRTKGTEGLKADGVRSIRIGEDVIEKLKLEEGDRIMFAKAGDAVFIAKCIKGTFGYNIKFSDRKNYAMASTVSLYNQTKLAEGNYNVVNPFKQDGIIWWNLKVTTK